MKCQIEKNTYSDICFRFLIKISKLSKLSVVVVLFMERVLLEGTTIYCFTQFENATLDIRDIPSEWLRWELSKHIFERNRSTNQRVSRTNELLPLDNSQILRIDDNMSKNSECGCLANLKYLIHQNGHLRDQLWVSAAVTR